MVHGGDSATETDQAPDRAEMAKVWNGVSLPDVVIRDMIVVNSLIATAKLDHYSAMVEENGKDSKSLFRVIDTLLHRDRQSPLPEHDSPQQLAVSFNDYFTDKVSTIRSSLEGSTAAAVPTELPTPSPSLPALCHMDKFQPATETEIMKIVTSSLNKPCDLDNLGMSRIISSYGLDKHFYADDTQLYCTLKPTQQYLDNLVCRMVRCIIAIRDWTKHNFLKFNDDKTEVW